MKININNTVLTYIVIIIVLIIILLCFKLNKLFTNSKNKESFVEMRNTKFNNTKPAKDSGNIKEECENDKDCVGYEVITNPELRKVEYGSRWGKDWKEPNLITNISSLYIDEPSYQAGITTYLKDEATKNRNLVKYYMGTNIMIPLEYVYDIEENIRQDDALYECLSREDCDGVIIKDNKASYFSIRKPYDKKGTNTDWYELNPYTIVSAPFENNKVFMKTIPYNNVLNRAAPSKHAVISRLFKPYNIL